MNTPRRTALAWLMAGAAMPTAAASAMPAMTDGPFYPSRAWRARRDDWDADLTRIRDGGSTRVAQGEHLALQLQVVDTRGRTIDGAEVEIWQCDVRGVYRHPNQPTADAEIDAGFQGFGAGRSDSLGQLAFRTIRPVPYAGRTPHIHVKLRHASFGELTSQLFVAGDAGNDGDFLWRRLNADARDALAMRVKPASGAGLAWRVQHKLVLPA